MLKELGYDFWEWGAAGAFIPTKSDDEWKKHRDAKILSAPLPLRSCNGFLPGTFRLTGPEASFDEPLKYAETVCRRADEVGVKTVVFGSSGARNVPKDCKDVEKGVEQMTENIVGVHLRFRPEGAKGEDLTSRMLKEKCTFQAYQLIKTKYKVIDGKRKAYQERTPLDTYAIAHYEPEP